MSGFSRKSKDEIRKMSVDEFCEYMSEWDRMTEADWHETSIEESEMPVFESKEAARKCLGAISFEEFEQKYL